MKKSTKSKPRIRNAEATQKRIMQAAKKEFARNGFGGARVDAIASRAKANKRMIYHYFGSKGQLFQKVLENAYLDIRNAEQRLDLDHLSPGEALKTLIRFTWTYYLDNPEFITLVNSENLHKARHLKTLDTVRLASRRFVDMMNELLVRGVAAGEFRPGVDPVQLNITIAAIGYYYLTNRYTGAIIYDRDLMGQEALDERLAFNIDSVMRIVRA